ncbi:SgcJ/EcaC family oxidoreductase [Rhodocytophaga aerolata]|uniref:SgcJ/EcaC family oxidoreductase n=1 Tax=Rhodocytophaga aerolata TaxID=455078 RepID=A0ABT8RJM7_9BACT|nr:SgcJ/EcaC family oxidoreductase [Rhodocytophaga aerolata]MDO1451463.1 SgcJ/EcaC family oxidoreductase [Rhodocytophaga aerolata]
MNKSKAFNQSLLQLLFATLVVCAWMIFVSCQKEAGSLEADVEAIKAVSEARAEAFRKGNAAGIAAHFTEDAILMAPDQPAQKGKAAVAAYYQALFDSYTPALKSEYEQVEVAGDLAYGRGFAQVVLTPKQGGEALKSTAKYLNILKRQPDGSWKTTHDIWNSNQPTQRQEK